MKHVSFRLRTLFPPSIYHVLNTREDIYLQCTLSCDLVQEQDILVSPRSDVSPPQWRIPYTVDLTWHLLHNLTGSYSRIKWVKTAYFGILFLKNMWRPARNATTSLIRGGQNPDQSCRKDMLLWHCNDITAAWKQKNYPLLQSVLLPSAKSCVLHLVLFFNHRARLLSTARIAIFYTILQAD